MKLSKLTALLTVMCLFISLSGISYAQTYCPPSNEVYAVHEDGSVVVAAYITTEDGFMSPNTYYVVSQEYVDLYIARKLSNGMTDCLIEFKVSTQSPNY